MGVTNRQNLQEVKGPSDTKTSVGQPGIDIPKQAGAPVGKKGAVGIETGAIRRAKAKRKAIQAAKAPPTVPQAGASTAATSKKSSDAVFKLDKDKWRNVLGSYGIKDLM